MRRRPRLLRLRRTAAFLVAATVPVAVYAVVALRHMTYAWDDFVQFGVTLRSGVGRELLTYDLFEHFGPANRLAHGLLVTFGGLDTRWAFAVAVPIFFVYCAALTDLARLLGAGWGRVALVLAVTTVTPATVSVSAVFDQYFHVLVPVTATVVATGAYVRWARTRRLVHAVVGALAVTLACAVQERGAFVVVFLVLARVLVIDGGVLPGFLMGGWLRTWLRDIPFLLVPVLAAAATTTIVARGYVSDAPRGELLETVVLVGRSWAERLVPMVAGAYGVDDGVALPILSSVAVLALVVWTVLRSTWNVRPWLLVVAWFALLTTFLGLGRLGISTVEAAMSDPQYLTYALPAVGVLIASLDVRRRPAPAPEPAIRPGARWTSLAQLGAAAVLGALLVHSSLPASARAGQFAPGYLDASVADVLRANDAGTAIVAPTRVPGGLVPEGFFPYNSGELFLRLLDRRTVVDIDPRSPLFLAADGHLTSASAEPLARTELGAPGAGATVVRATTFLEGGTTCLSADGAGALSVPLPATVDLPGGAAWVRLIAHGDGAEGTVAVGGSAGWAIGATAPLTAAHGSVTFMVPAPDVSEVQLLDVRADRLCVEAVEVWALSTGSPDGSDGCAWVGPGGEAVPAAPTPSRCTGSGTAQD